MRKHFLLSHQVKREVRAAGDAAAETFETFEPHSRATSESFGFQKKERRSKEHGGRQKADKTAQ